MELSKKEKCRIVTGQGFWHTADLKHQLPSLHLSDGPHGVRSQKEGALNNNSKKATCFPTASAIACSFDRHLIAQTAHVLAQEAIQDGVSILLGPGANMKRSPLCGRNFEYYAEDPYLSGELAASFIDAVQKERVGTSMKHFAGNSQETRRHTENSIIDERALHEIYLRAFQIAVEKAQPATIMAAYNRVNGEYCTQNRTLLTDILRDQWHFEGAVISDWGACSNLKASVEAGMDLEMPDSHGLHFADLYHYGDEKAIERASQNVLRLLEKYPARSDARHKTYHHAQAVKAAVESAVLLKNEGILPLRKDTKILLVGEMAEKIRYQGGGSSHVNATYVPDCISSMQREFSHVVYAKGYSFNRKENQTQLWKEACQLAKDADVVVFCGGLSELDEGEGFDRQSFDAEPQMVECLQELAKVNANIVYVSFSGSSYALPFLPKIKAMLQMYLGGEGVSEAVSLLLSGKENPSGKLAETWPCRLEDVPCYGNFALSQNDIAYKESIFIGYRYYDTFAIPVAFPFGYGLSYTSFTMEQPAVKVENGNYDVSVDVTNNGERAGACVVEVFVKNPQGDFLRAQKELRGFEKVFLQAGEKKNVHISLDDHAFMVYDTESGWVTVPGEYEIQICSAINQVACSVKIEIEGTPYRKNQRDVLPAYFKQGKLEVSQEMFAKLYEKPVPYLRNEQPGSFDMTSSLSALAPYSKWVKAILWFGEHLLAKVLYPGRNQEDPEIKMMIQGLREGTVDMICMHSKGLISHQWMEKQIEKMNRKKI